MASNIRPARSSGVDIFQLLMETAEKEKKKRRQEILESQGVTEIFVEGSITINMRTCRGVDCKLCIKVCPTNALFWKAGEVGIVLDLCIYCGACVLSCIVDDCMKIERKRLDGKVESFSKPKDFTSLQHEINARKRFQRVAEIKDLLPKPEEYIERRKTKTNGN